MTNDRDDRRREALKREVDRLRQYAATTRVDHAESASLTDKHVSGLASVLLSSVRTALRGEVGTTLLAKEWVSEARTVATWLLRTGAVDVNALSSVDTLKSPAEAVWDRVTRLKHFFGFESAKLEGVGAAAPPGGTQAEQQLVDSLEAKLNDSAYYEVGEDEVREHSTDLARLLISNWFGVLEAAVQEQPDEPVKLEYRAFPPSASPGVVTEGCEGFALPAEQAISKVFEYQKSLAAPGHSVALSPIVSLYRSKSGPWYAFHTRRSSVVDMLRSQERQRPQREEILFRATQAFSPLAIGRAMQFQGSLSMKTALVHECSVAAANVVRLRLKSKLVQSGLTESISLVVHSHQISPALTKQMAHAVLQDLDALGSSRNFFWESEVEKVNRAAKLVLYEHDEASFLGDAYMLALPATAALLAEGNWDEAAASTPAWDSYVPDIEEQLFSTTVAIVTSAVAEAAESQSGQAALGKKIRNMMEPGHEPSAFGLLL